MFLVFLNGSKFGLVSGVSPRKRNQDRPNTNSFQFHDFGLTCVIVCDVTLMMMMMMTKPP